MDQRMNASATKASFTIAPKSSAPLPVQRLGYGAMQLTGPGIWDMPADTDAAIALLRRAVELGVNFIDTADSYGPHSNEELIRRALHPYEGICVATKGGLVRTGPHQWHSVGQPMYLRQCVEMSLRRLGQEHITLWQLHRVDSTVPLADQIGELALLQQEGKIAHIGLSEVDVATLEAAQAVTPIAAVQNRYNIFSTGSQPVLDYCEANGIAFIPWFPLKNRELALTTGDESRFAAVERVATSLGATVAQIALAWLLHKSEVVLPIPGTKSIAHLEENMASAQISLDDDVMTVLNSLGHAD